MFHEDTDNIRQIEFILPPRHKFHGNKVFSSNRTYGKDVGKRFVINRTFNELWRIGCSTQEDAIKVLEKSLEDAKNQLKGIMKLKVAEKIKRPNDTDLIDSLYDEIESDLINRVKGCENQILMLNEQRKALVNSKRLLKTAFDIFDAILQKDQLEKKDLAVVIDKINVYEDHIDIALNPDIDALLHSSSEIEAISEEIVQKATHQKDRHFTVNVIRDGEELRLHRCPLWQPGMRNAAWADKRRL